jgi:hypothetical protein
MKRNTTPSMDDLAGAAKKIDDTGSTGESSNDDSFEKFDLEKHKHAKSLSKTKASSSSNEESESVEIGPNQKKTYYLFIIKNVFTY